MGDDQAHLVNRSQQGSDVVADQVLGIFAVAHEDVVDKKVGSAFHAGKIDVDALAIARRDGETPLVDTIGYYLGENGRLRVLGTEIIRDIGVDRITESLPFPVPGDLYFCLFSGLRVKKIPLSVQ